jgi:hypothetical protein
MPAHWTYDVFKPTADLAQGDIIEPTPALRRVLQEVHPHFLDSKYVAFMVLSQSCDLVRRAGYRGQPINLCVVRELRAIAGRLLELYCGSDIPTVFLKEARNEGRMFLERTINQNEQAVGLFYLHPDADAGVATPCVAMLRIAIALHTMHYDTIRESRRGRLKEGFQAKLGWLIGNLYSRVGTEDWSEPKERKREQRKIVDQTFDSLPGIKWASSEAVARATKGGFSIEGKIADDISNELDAFEPPPLDKQVLGEIQRIIAEADLGISPDAQARLLRRLPNDARMAELLRRMRKL